MKKKAIIITGTALVVAGAGYHFWGSSQAAPVVVATETVAKRTITEKVTAVGTILPGHITTVRSALSGIVTHVYKNIGDPIKQGDTLALVGPSVAPATLAQALATVAAQEAKVAADKKLVANDKKLIDNHLASPNYSAYISDLSTLKQDLATLEYNKQNLGLVQYGKATVAGKEEKGQVTSPITGYILQRNVDVGDSIISISASQSATNLYTIADMSDMVFDGSVDELDANKLKAGMTASVSVGPLSGVAISGKLLRLGLQSNQENAKYGTTTTTTTSPFNVGFQVQVGDLALPKGVQLKSGFSATATFISQVHKDVPTLPQSVVHFTATSAYVLVPNGKKGGSRKVTIKTGLSDSSYVEILSGLKVGDKVLKQ